MLYHCHFKKQLIYILQFSVILFIYCRIKFLVSFIYCYIYFLNVTYFFFLFLFCSLSLILYQIVHIELLFHVTHLCFYESSQHANFVISVLVKVKSQKFSKTEFDSSTHQEIFYLYQLSQPRPVRSF